MPPLMGTHTARPGQFHPTNKTNAIFKMNLGQQFIRNCFSIQPGEGLIVGRNLYSQIDGSVIRYMTLMLFISLN